MPLPPPKGPSDPRTMAEVLARLAQMEGGERRLRELINADPFAILIGTTEGEIRYMNPPLRELLGYSAAQIEAGEVRWDEITPPEFAERDHLAIEELVTIGRTRLYEKEFRAHDGRRIPVLLGASIISDGRGGQEVACFITDLSELQSVQRELNDRNTSIAISDERSRQLLRANPFGIMISRFDGVVEYANPPLLQMLGYTASDLDVGHLNWRTMTPPEHQARSLAAVTEIKAKGICSTYEKDFFARDGSRVPVLIGSALIPNLEGQLDIASFITDLSELKRTQRDLEESRRQLASQLARIETIYRTAPVSLGYYDITPEFRLLQANDKMAELLGQPKEKLIGQTLAQLAPKLEVRHLFEQVASGIPVVNQIIEGEIPGFPGEIRTWRSNYFPVFSPTGEVQGITSSSVDITSLKRSEDALRESEKLAAVGRLASSISHEINNPLEAITNLLYLARTETDEARRSEYLESAEHEVARVSQIATQTLRFHRQPGRPTAMAASDLVEPVLALYAGRLTNSGITIDRRYRSQTSFLCMEGDLRQVMNNLIGNAIDAMRSGGRLLIRTSDALPLGSEEPMIRITIADTGAGMSNETQRRIYEAFYTTKGSQGTGLGMWISKGIVDKHGGRLRLRSTKDKGTVFELLLPLEPPPGFADAEKPA